MKVIAFILTVVLVEPNAVLGAKVGEKCCSNNECTSQYDKVDSCLMELTFGRSEMTEGFCWDGNCFLGHGKCRNKKKWGESCLNAGGNPDNNNCVTRLCDAMTRKCEFRTSGCASFSNCIEQAFSPPDGALDKGSTNTRAKFEISLLEFKEVISSSGMIPNSKTRLRTLQTSTTSSSWNVKGKADVSVAPDIDFDFKPAPKLTVELPMDIDLDFDLKLLMTQTFESVHTVTQNLLSKPLKLWKGTLPLPGGIPVPVVLEAQIHLRGDFELFAELATEANIKCKLKGQLANKWEICLGSDEDCASVKELTELRPECEGTLEATAKATALAKILAGPVLIVTIAGVEVELAVLAQAVAILEGKAVVVNEEVCAHATGEVAASVNFGIAVPSINLEEIMMETCISTRQTTYPACRCFDGVSEDQKPVQCRVYTICAGDLPLLKDLTEGVCLSSHFSHCQAIWRSQPFWFEFGPFGNDQLPDCRAPNASLTEANRECLFAGLEPPSSEEITLCGDSNDAGNSCFEGSNLVRTPLGLVEMKTLRAGDLVEATPGVFEPIILLPQHWTKGTRGNEQIKTEYLSIEVGKGTSLLQTKGHMIFAGKKANNTQLVRAGDLQLGDWVQTETGESARITRIQRVQGQGAFTPYTPSLKMVVSGLQTSCLIDHPWATSQPALLIWRAVSALAWGLHFLLPGVIFQFISDSISFLVLEPVYYHHEGMVVFLLLSTGFLIKASHST